MPLEQYLIDDVDLLVVVNVKGIVKSTLFNATIKKELQKVLDMPEVKLKDYLKDTGVDPLRDLERVVVMMGKSCRPQRDFNAPAPAGGVDDGPVVLLQGKFDQTKLEAALDKIAARPAKPPRFAKPGAKNVREMAVTKEGKRKYYTIDPDGWSHAYLAVIDKQTVVICGMKTHLKTLWERVEGKKKPALKYAKQWQPILKTFKPDQMVRAAGIENMVWTTRYEKNPNGATRREITLGDLGVTGFNVTVTIPKDVAIGTVAINGKEKASFAKVSKEIEDGLALAKKQLSDNQFIPAELKPSLEAFKKVLEGLKITKKDTSMTIEGKAGADAILGLFKSFFGFSKAG